MLIKVKLNKTHLIGPARFNKDCLIEEIRFKITAIKDFCMLLYFIKTQIY